MAYQLILATFVAVQGFIATSGFAQSNIRLVHYDSLSALVQSDSLRVRYGHLKKMPKAYEIPILLALSHYPELHSEKITFRIKKSKLPYLSRPTLGSIVWPFGSKKYIIIISNQSTKLREPTLLENLRFNAQIGALGHELGHTAYFKNRRRYKIMADGIRYWSLGYKKKLERLTDEIAIRHGLGNQILEWNKAVYPVKLRDGKRAKIYYNPQEITEILKHF